VILCGTKRKKKKPGHEEWEAGGRVHWGKKGFEGKKKDHPPRLGPGCGLRARKGGGKKNKWKMVGESSGEVVGPKQGDQRCALLKEENGGTRKERGKCAPPFLNEKRGCEKKRK